MQKRFFALLLCAVMLVLCVGCGGSENPSDTQTGADVPPDPPLLREMQHRYLTVWSWQIPDPALAEVYAQKAVECGFTAVDLGVQWSAFEPLRGHFDWSWLDRVVKAFTDKGLGVSLQPLLWSKDLSWAEELAFQETVDGVFSVEERGSFVSFTDGNTLNVLKNTLQNFALHALSYGGKLTRWGVRLSAFGEFDYSVSAELDFSESSAVAFRDYIRENYDSVTALNEASGLTVASWSDLNNLSCADLAKACRLDWRLYRQQCLTEMQALVSGIFRSADKDVPIVFSLGNFGNGMNNGYSGVVDLWQVCQGDFDILSVALSRDVDAAMTLSVASSLCDKKLAVEVDGAGVWDEGDEVAVKDLVKVCGAYDVFSLATANFTAEQLDAHKSTLQTYETLLSSFTPSVKDGDPTKAILIFTHAVVQTLPPVSYEALYGDAWDAASEQGARRVRFVTDGQVGKNAALLKDVTDLSFGTVKGKIPVAQGFAAAVKDLPLAFDGLEFVAEE